MIFRIRVDRVCPSTHLGSAFERLLPSGTEPLRAGVCDAPRGPASGRLDRAPRSGGAGSRGASGSVPRGPAALRRFAFPPPERGALTALRPPRHSLFSVAVVAVSSTSFHRFRAHGRRHASGPRQHLRIPPGRRAADGHAAGLRLFESLLLFQSGYLACGRWAVGALHAPGHPPLVGRALCKRLPDPMGCVFRSAGRAGQQHRSLRLAAPAVGPQKPPPGPRQETFPLRFLLRVLLC